MSAVHVCHQCGLTFKARSILDIHTKSKHSGVTQVTDTAAELDHLIYTRPVVLSKEAKDARKNLGFKPEMPKHNTSTFVRPSGRPPQMRSSAPPRFDNRPAPKPRSAPVANWPQMANAGVRPPPLNTSTPPPQQQRFGQHPGSSAPPSPAQRSFRGNDGRPPFQSHPQGNFAAGNPTQFQARSPAPSQPQSPHQHQPVRPSMDFNPPPRPNRPVSVQLSSPAMNQQQFSSPAMNLQHIQTPYQASTPTTPYPSISYYVPISPGFLKKNDFRPTAKKIDVFMEDDSFQEITLSVSSKRN